MFNEFDEQHFLWQGDTCQSATSVSSTDDYFIECSPSTNYGENVCANEVPYENDLTLSELKSWPVSDERMPPIFDNSDWELNIEALLFENYLDVHDEWPHQTASMWLPDKTVLCSDSCTMFLKESAENLYTNFQSFSPDASMNVSTLNAMSNVSSNNADDNDATTAADKVFPCTFTNCAKVYAKAAHLKAHLRRHIGDKPYVCTWPECTWKFSRSDELARHRRSHSGIKPYKCVYCTKCFSRSDHLSKHRKVHERKLAMAALKNKNSNSMWTSSANKVGSMSCPDGRPGRRAKASLFLV